MSQKLAALNIISIDYVKNSILRVFTNSLNNVHVMKLVRKFIRKKKCVKIKKKKKKNRYRDLPLIISTLSILI